MRIAYLLQALVLLLCSACLGQSNTSLPLSTLPAGAAIVRDLKGDVSVQLPHSTSSPAGKGQQLPPDTVIETGNGRVLLQLQDGSQVLLKSHSRVVLRAPQQATGNFLETLLGKVLATVRKRIGGEPPFRMGTPTAVITVRGTRFLTEVSDKPKTSVSVYEGIVEVVGLGAPGAPVLLGPGFSTTVERDQDPDPPQLLPQFSGGAGTRIGSRQERDRESGARRSQSSDGQQQEPGSSTPDSPEQEVED